MGYLGRSDAFLVEGGGVWRTCGFIRRVAGSAGGGEGKGGGSGRRVWGLMFFFEGSFSVLKANLYSFPIDCGICILNALCSATPGKKPSIAGSCPILKITVIQIVFTIVPQSHVLFNACPSLVHPQHPVTSLSSLHRRSKRQLEYFK